jgi:alpha-galactosidase
VIRHHADALPAWPLGLPAWTDPQVALASGTDDVVLLFVWNRDPVAGAVALDVPALRGAEVTAETVFPTALPAWRTDWDAAAGVLTVDLAGAGEAARVLRLTRGRR